MIMKYSLALSSLLLAGVLASSAQELAPKPDGEFFAKFQPLKAPATTGLLLKKGDRLAIIGDSITEQKMYSRAMETYLTVCVPELEVTTRQYGWGGETAEGFRARMQNDCLRFEPTIATTCYGMNDHRYKAFTAENGAWYESNQLAIVRAFKATGARMVLGSPGCVGSKVPWAKGGSEDMNLNLCELRNIDLRMAGSEGVAFADVFWPMFTAGYAAQQQHGADYAIAGKDGVHPGWSGSFIMAYAFLKALGLDGDLGRVEFDLTSGKVTASGGHEVLQTRNGAASLVSKRYPFCATGEAKSDDSIRSAMTLVPFNQELNRFTLVARNGKAAKYRVVWGAAVKSYTAAELEAGVNLAADFPKNPFSDAFAKVDKAVAAKQEYETRQIKTLFHGPEGKVDMETVVKLTERAREPFVAAVREAFVPVKYALEVLPE
jgi:lysophospholipase L1-like esterase